MKLPRLLAAGLLVLTATACASSEADSGSGTLRIGVIGSGVGNKLTRAVGFLEQRGELLPELKAAGITKIKVATFPNGPDLNQALAGGSLDIGMYGDTPALIGRGQGLPTRLLSLNSVRLDAAIVAKKDGGPASLKDLEGKRIGVQTGSYIHRYLLGALEQAGVRPKEIIHMYTPAIIAALEKDSIDAGGLVSADQVAQEQKGYRSIDVASRDHPDLLGTSVTVVTEKYLAGHKDIVKVWQKAETKAVRASKADWANYTAYVGETGGYAPDISIKTTLQDQLPDEPFPAEGLKLLEGTKAFLVQQTLIKKDYTLDSWLAPGART
ncbi:ABC transporter substrate-binding protein [Actinomadura madurae]|uniref:ABC transporter substrate-binding protein n=1 Tax=Actinomadura madurae TaxID=1993 RepID=UPI0020260243|nr:ABC transporter substrate-binding protein [Actinomadura madurae]MCP9948141.1 ABC transporter substrate-binding protein [Actinomadura madurae]MCP9964913.1 ABC transporter substrate-binding protein [Actinomadura madurae]MCP9977402.1 ABC transporter substrate-binding protein [Actinomadura madurae]MCQ0011093.1 ABC transporter substrate-binding protein [Actinomadura madurae]MCQ0013582.1 ABC transporter substrate-binding protein [Actinomadura madurae]